MGEIDLFTLDNIPGDGDDDGGGSYAEYILSVVDNGYILETIDSKYVFTNKQKLLDKLKGILP